MVVVRVARKVALRVDLVHKVVLKVDLLCKANRVKVARIKDQMEHLIVVKILVL